MKSVFAYFLLVSAVIFSSCTSNKLFNSNGIQKRKYQNGFFIRFGSIPSNYCVKPSIAAFVPLQTNPNQPLIDEHGGSSINHPDTCIEKGLSKPICDKIVLCNGNIIEGKVTDITDAMVFYVSCDKQQTEMRIDRDAVNYIKYYNGDKGKISNCSNIDNTTYVDTVPVVLNANIATPKLRHEQTGTTAVIFSLLSLPVFLFFSMIGGAILAALAIILGITNLILVGQNKDKYKKDNYGVIAVFLGILFLAVTILVMSTVI